MCVLYHPEVAFLVTIPVNGAIQRMKRVRDQTDRGIFLQIDVLATAAPLADHRQNLRARQHRVFAQAVIVV